MALFLMCLSSIGIFCTTAAGWDPPNPNCYIWNGWDWVPKCYYNPPPDGYERQNYCCEDGGCCEPWEREGCCEGTCKSHSECPRCCDGKKCYNTDTQGCCGYGTGKLCNKDQTCCEDNCCEPNEICCDGECYNPSPGDSWTGPDWVPPPPASCDASCGATQGGSAGPDTCGNIIKSECSGSGGENCAFHYYYNGTEVGTCIWHNGYNDFQNRKTSDGKVIHSTRQVSIHRCNSGCSDGCAPQGYYCWKVTYYDGGSPSSVWYRSKDYPITDKERFEGISEDGRIEIEPCPGH